MQAVGDRHSGAPNAGGTRSQPAAVQGGTAPDPPKPAPALNQEAVNGSDDIGNYETCEGNRPCESYTNSGYAELAYSTSMVTSPKQDKFFDKHPHVN